MSALQRGGNAEELEQLKKDAEARRATKAAKAHKVFYRVTVKASTSATECSRHYQYWQQ